MKNKKLENDVQLNNELRSSLSKNEDEITPVTIVNIYGGKKNKIIKKEGLKVLLDTGCCTSIAKEKHCQNKKRNKVSNYATGGGALKTKYESEIHFALPEFSDKKIIKWNFNITSSDDLGYDMIIGRDILMTLGINFSFVNKTVEWEGISIPMRDFNKIKKYKLSKYEIKAII